MNEYRHHVSGFFARRDEAETALEALAKRGLARDRMQIFKHEEAPALDKAGSNAVLKNMVVDGAIGTAVGTGLGALAQFALVAANVSLFVASPLLAPLVMLGWGASLGATVGAMVGAEKKDGPLSALVTDAIASGQVVLVAQTLSEAETATARNVIQAAVGAVKDVSTV